jgi:hypothetical protein
MVRTGFFFEGGIIMSATAWSRNPARGWSILIGLLVLTGAGCGERGRVSGTVSYRGRPLPDGTVLLLASDRRSYHGQIGPDGRFAIPEVPSGEAHVAVTSLVEGARSNGRAGGAGHGRVGPQAPRVSRIPIGYSDLAQSALRATITGDTDLDLDLK